MFPNVFISGSLVTFILLLLSLQRGVIVPHVVTVLSLITLVVRAKLAVLTVAAKNTSLELVLRNTINGEYKPGL